MPPRKKKNRGERALGIDLLPAVAPPLPELPPDEEPAPALPQAAPLVDDVRRLYRSVTGGRDIPTRVDAANLRASVDARAEAVDRLTRLRAAVDKTAPAVRRFRAAQAAAKSADVVG